MSVWLVIFCYPFVAAEFDPNEDKLSKLIVKHGGDFEAGADYMGRREVYGTFVTKLAAEKCGQAAYYLNIQFLSWEVEEVEVTA
jgi:hypothetical protein